MNSNDSNISIAKLVHTLRSPLTALSIAHGKLVDLNLGPEALEALELMALAIYNVDKLIDEAVETKLENSPGSTLSKDHTSLNS